MNSSQKYEWQCYHYQITNVLSCHPIPQYVLVVMGSLDMTLMLGLAIWIKCEVVFSLLCL